mgnify:FL=1
MIRFWNYNIINLNNKQKSWIKIKAMLRSSLLVTLVLEKVVCCCDSSTINSMNSMNLLWVLLSCRKFITITTEKLHVFKLVFINVRYGTRLVNRNTSPSLPFTTEVHFSIYQESQVALCVYDITSKNSFQVMKNWV